MSNPAILVSQFDSDLAYTDQSGAGVWTGVDPIRYDVGLWVEEATVNLCRNPSFESGTTTWSANTGTLSQDTGTAHVGSASLLTTRSGATGNLGPFFTTSNSTIAEGGYVAVTLAAKADYAPTTCVLECYWRTDASGALGSAATTQFSLTADFVERTYVFGPAPATTGKAIIGLTDQSNGTIGENLWVDAVQVENKGYATSYADYTMGAGYGGSLGSHSTRAASSASVTIDEPVSVACWYREGYSGVKQFAYLDTLGQLGDYGDISYAAGDLTISTTRNLVIGPFAAFDRTLTEHEQRNLKSTQNWTMNSVNGSNIVLPFSGARRRRR